ncbi:hypothetical protein ACJJTC_002495 [Scirpophaga incertulas]
MRLQAEKCALLKNKTDKRTLVTEVAGLLYSGQEDNQDISKTLVLARNKVTGKVRLIEASCVELAPVLNIEQRKIHIDEIVPRNLSSPLILHFQNGYASSKFKAEKCALLKNKTDKRTLVTEVAGLLYSGQEDNQDISKTLVLARNKVTGKVRLIEASCVELAPVLNIEQRSSEFDTSYLELSRKFGSKKQ